MRTVYTNVNVATMSDGLGEILDAQVVVEDGLISEVGPRRQHVQAENTVDGKGGWLLPGLIDCHTHLVYGGNRAQEFKMRLEGVSFLTPKRRAARGRPSDGGGSRLPRSNRYRRVNLWVGVDGAELGRSPGRKFF